MDTSNPVSLATTSGTRATRRSPGTVSESTPIFTCRRNGRRSRKSTSAAPSGGGGRVESGLDRFHPGADGGSPAGEETRAMGFNANELLSNGLILAALAVFLIARQFMPRSINPLWMIGVPLVAGYLGG